MVYRFSLVFVLIFTGFALAQDGDYENFRIEITVTVPFLHPSGSVELLQSTGVDFESDLGLRDRKPQFFGKLVIKPARKHRLLVEGIPYRFDGQNTLLREFVIGGRRLELRDNITSRAELNYVFGGYQYDILSRERGHLGVLAGVSHWDTMVTAQSTARPIAGTESVSVPIPLVGAEFRGYPLRHSNLVNVNGEIKGMSFDGYGRFLQASMNVGVSLGRRVTVQAGYFVLDADVHRKDGRDRIRPRFDGPAFSIQLRDR